MRAFAQKKEEAKQKTRGGPQAPGSREQLEQIVASAAGAQEPVWIQLASGLYPFARPRVTPLGEAVF